MKLKLSIGVFSKINCVQHFTFFTKFAANHILHANGVNGLEFRAIFDRFNYDRRYGYCLIVACAMVSIVQIAVDASYRQNIAAYHHLDRCFLSANCLNDGLFDIC